MRALFIALTIVAAWLGMQLAHEFGHMLGAFLTGGVVEHVSLHPLSLSRTDVAPNPSPLVVVWMGPIVGCVLPVMLWGLAKAMRASQAFLLRFFAGFCLVANGAYIGVGSFDRVGDCGEMLRFGTPIWLLWAFGAVAIALGFWLWHGQGRYFGFGREPSSISVLSVVLSASAAAALLLLGLAVGA